MRRTHAPLPELLLPSDWCRSPHKRACDPSQERPLRVSPSTPTLERNCRPATHCHAMVAARHRAERVRASPGLWRPHPEIQCSRIYRIMAAGFRRNKQPLSGQSIARQGLLPHMGITPSSDRRLNPGLGKAVISKRLDADRAHRSKAANDRLCGGWTFTHDTLSYQPPGVSSHSQLANAWPAKNAGYRCRLRLPLLRQALIVGLG